MTLDEQNFSNGPTSRIINDLITYLPSVQVPSYRMNPKWSSLMPYMDVVILTAGHWFYHSDVSTSMGRCVVLVEQLHPTSVHYLTLNIVTLDLPTAVNWLSRSDSKVSSNCQSMPYASLIHDMSPSCSPLAVSP